MSPYRDAPAVAAPHPKRSAVVRLWRMGRRLDPVTATLMPVVGTLAAIVIALTVAALTRDIVRGFAAGYAVFLFVPPFYLLRGYLRLRRVRAALAPCPTHRALGKHGRCGHYACCYACFRKDYDDVMALGERSAELQREAVARLTRYQATTETRERARYASGATAAVSEARDRRKRPCHVCGEVDRCDAGLHS